MVYYTLLIGLWVNFQEKNKVVCSHFQTTFFMVVLSPLYTQQSYCIILSNVENAACVSKINSASPRIDSWETPLFTGCRLDSIYSLAHFVSLTSTIWIWSENNLNSVLLTSNFSNLVKIRLWFRQLKALLRSRKIVQLIFLLFENKFRCLICKLVLFY